MTYIEPYNLKTVFLTAKKNNTRALIETVGKKKAAFIEKVKALQGNPHHIAVGMALGVLVSFTPTIPFHSLISLVLAFVFRASMPAAFIGSLFSNPLTIPLMYMASYHVGIWLWGDAHLNGNLAVALVQGMEHASTFAEKGRICGQFLTTQLHLFFKMLAGGIVMGTVPAGIAYGTTYAFIKKLRTEETHP